MKPQPKIETKNVKHVFTDAERLELGASLARQLGALRGIEAELDQVKASYKAKTAECEAKIDSISTAVTNGFEMRNEKCVVLFRPDAKQKDYYLQTDYENQKGTLPIIISPVLSEPMTEEDFQYELIQAESKFDNREEIQLFQPTDSDRGILAVGRFGGKWFGALRVKIGKLELTERLDSEQKAFKERADCVAQSVKRFDKWSKDNLKDLAKGFQDQSAAVAEAHKDRAE